MNKWTLVSNKILMIPKSLMTQQEFQLEEWTSIIQKFTVIPPSSMDLFLEKSSAVTVSFQTPILMIDYLILKVGFSVSTNH